jgi:Uma2 family endonuclease
MLTYGNTPVLEEEIVEQIALSDYEMERNKPMPNLVHGVIQTQITHLLKSNYAAELTMVSELALDTQPRPSTPDICIYPKQKVDIKTMVARQTNPPITTIEILSPSQSLNELMHKAWDMYFPFGVKSAWIVVPEFRVIHVMQADNAQQLFTTGLLTDPATGIQIEVEKVFEDLI